MHNRRTNRIFGTFHGLRITKSYACAIIVTSIVFLIFIFPSITKQESKPATLFDFRAYTEPKLADLPEIREACEVTEWHDDIYLECYYLNMGAFNAINRLHVCIRWAIDAGVGLVIPSFVPRDQRNISNLWSDTIPHVPLDYLMDEAYIWKALAYNCPQMKVLTRSELGDADELHGLWGAPSLQPINSQLRKGDFKKYFHAHVAANLTRTISTRKLPVLVREKDSLLAWNVTSDSTEFQIDFHRLTTHFNERFVHVAQNILFKLPYIFYGLHYRQEKDWRTFPDTPTDEQIAKLPLAFARSSSPVLYTACGDVAKLIEFKEIARKLGFDVVGKWDLIDEGDKEFLEGLEFDQLGMVDFIILMHSEIFWGFGGSTFSHSVGLWRHIYQFHDLHFTGEDFQQRLIGPRIVQEFMFNMLW